MGRPKKDVIENFKKRLEWFSLERYDRLKQLDMLDWFKQIQVRRSLYERLTVGFPGQSESGMASTTICSDAKLLLSVIRETPILDFNEEPQFEFEIPSLQTPVHSTTIEEFYLGELAAQQWKISKARRFFDKAGEFRFEVWRDGYRPDFYGRAENVASVIDSELSQSGDTEDCTFLDDGLEREFFFDKDIRIGHWAESPLHKYLGLNDVAILSIDLNTPESILVEHFKAVVNQLKTDQQKLRAEKLNPTEWIRCGLLPYIDLELWRLIDALPRSGTAVAPIPDPLIRDLILREDDSENSKFASTEHTIRTVTREYFNRMFATQSSLFALLESEAAAQFHCAGTVPRFQRNKLRKRLEEKKQRNKIAKVPVNI